MKTFKFFTSVKRITSLSVFIASVSLSCSSFAGEKESLNSQSIKPWVSQKIIPKKVNIDLRTIEQTNQWKAGDAIKDIPRRRFKPNYVTPSAPVNPVLTNKDPLLSKQKIFSANSANSRSVELQFEGSGYTGVNPPDTTGDVGLNYYIQSINGSSGSIFTVYDKSTGTLVSGPINMETLGSGNCATGAGDPIVLFDEMADRWILSEFSSFGNNLCVYVSQTADPIAGGWFAYSFASPSFPDYPKYGVGVDAYYVGTNENSSTVYALDRVQMLAGNPATMIRLQTADLAGFGFQMIQPVDHDGSIDMPAGTPGYFLRHRDDEVHNAGSNNPAEDYIELWQFNADFNNTNNASFTKIADFPIADFDSDLCGLVSFSCFPQAGSNSDLDPLREVVMFRAQYRNFGSYETIVGNFVTDVDGSDHGGIRWFELRRDTGSWSLFQEGTYSPDQKNRWMGSIAMDKQGNIALAYSWGSSVDFPGIRYTGRLSGDASGAMTETETTLVNGTTGNASNRWGDYSHLSVDPVDECTFWYTNQYGKTGGQWGTHIASFKFDSCGTGGNISPTAAFTSSCTDLNCAFDGSSSSDSDGTVDAYFWDFGDGATATTATPNHIYATAGIYSVSLTVTDNEGATGSSSQSVNAGNFNAAPTADFNFTVTDLNVVFADSSSDSDGIVSAWSWDFGDGNTSSIANPTNNFAVAGTYAVSLTVTDDDGATNTSVQNVTATEPSNVITGGWTETNVGPSQGQLINYTIVVPTGADSLEVSTSGGTGNVDLAINFGSAPTRNDNDCLHVTAGNNHTCSITIPTPGTWFITVRGAQASSGVQVDAYWFSTVTGNVAPTADFNFTAVQLVTSFTDASTDSDGSISAWSWDFGDGNTSTLQNPSNTYAIAGSYNVTLTVTDDDGASNSSTQTVTVSESTGSTGGWTESNISLTAGQTISYTIVVPAGAATLEVDTSGGTGDADMAIKFGSTPTRFDNDCVRIGFGNVHNCTITNPTPGTWFVLLRGAQTSSGVNLDAYWSE